MIIIILIILLLILSINITENFIDTESYNILLNDKKFRSRSIDKIFNTNISNNVNNVNNTNELNKEQFKKQLNKKQFNKNNIDTEEVKHKINVRDISAELNDISQEMNIKELSIEKHKRISELAEENRKYNNSMRELAESKHLLNLNTNKLFTLEQKFHTMKSTLESNNELLKDIRRKLLINPIDDETISNNSNNSNNITKKINNLKKTNLKKTKPKVNTNTNTDTDTDNNSSDTETNTDNNSSDTKTNTDNNSSDTETKNNFKSETEMETKNKVKKISYHSELANKDMKINELPHIVKPEFIPSTATTTPVSSKKYAKSILRTVKSIDRSVNCPPCPSFENTMFVDSGEVSVQTLGTIVSN